jgi:hypothetical protein
MAKTKVLITVKTYPAISTKYDELVCTAGFLEDGSWIRIYPIQFRKRPYAEQYIGTFHPKPVIQYKLF